METICLSLGGIVTSSRAQIGSLTLVYLWSAVFIFNCMEKNGKFRIPCRISNMVLFRWRNERPINGLVSFSMTIKISWKSMSSTSSLSSTVLFGVCPLATIIWKLGAGLSLIIDCGANNRISRRSASGIVLDRAPVSIRPSNVTSPKSIGIRAYVSCILVRGWLSTGRSRVYRLVRLSFSQIVLPRLQLAWPQVRFGKASSLVHPGLPD